MGIHFAHGSRFVATTAMAGLIERLPRVLCPGRTLTAALLGLLLLTAHAAQAAPFAYIAHPTSNQITVLDTATNTISATVPVGTSPFGVAVNSAGTQVYVANFLSNTVSVIDAASNTVTATVAVGRGPRGVAVNPAGTRVYVTDQLDDTVSVIDTAGNTVIATVDLRWDGGTVGGNAGTPWSVAVNSAGSRVYVASSNTVSVIDAGSNTVISRGVVPALQLRGLAVNSDGSRIYVLNPVNDNGPNVSVLDSCNTVVATVMVGGTPTGVVVNPAGTRVYVSRTDGVFNRVSVIDAASNAVIATVSAGRGSSGITINPTGTRVYVTNQSSSDVSVIDTASNTVIATIPTGADPQAIAMMPEVMPDPARHLRVTGMEVTQGIQDLANSVPLISGRRTFVRVYVQSDGPAVSGVTASLSGAGTFCTVGGCVTNPLGSLVPVNTVKTATTETPLTHITVSPNPKRSNLNDSFLFELPWAWTNYRALRLHAEPSVGSGPPRQSCPSDVLGALSHEFRFPLDLKIQFVRLEYRLPGTFNGLTDQLVQATLDEQRQSESFIRRTYPLRNLLSGPDYVLFDDQLGRHVGQGAQVCLDMAPAERNGCAHDYITSRLAAIQAASGFMRDAEGGYALIPQVPNDPTNIYFTRGACCTDRIGSGPSNQPDYAAHEILHLLGRGHPDEGAAECGHDGADPSYPYFLSFIGPGLLGPVASTNVATDLAGFDGGDASLPTPIPKGYHYGQNAFDNIGYCKPSWISDYTYKSLFCLGGLRRNNPDPTVGPSCGRLPPGLGASGPQMGDWLVVFGSTDPDLATASLHRVQRVDRVFDVPPRTPGSHSIRLIGAGGVTLADHPFTPEAIEDAETGAGGSKPVSFGHVVPFVSGTQEIQIVDTLAGNAVIGGKPVSPNPPVISNVALQALPDPAAQTVTVGWAASDPDGEPLTFDIYLARDDGASLQPLRLGVSDTSAEVGIARLGGGLVRLRVVATDGVQSAFADSAQFTLANKPPQLRILNPGDGGAIRLGQLVNFEGAASDPQDGEVAETALDWSIPGRSLGSGSRLSITDLPAGVNQVTLTATNSFGLSATTSVAVNVIENVELPGPTLTVGPGRIGWHVGVGESQIQTATVDIGNGGSGDLAFSVSSSAAWLTVSTATGNAPATITLMANPAGLAGGVTRRATVTLQAVGIPDQVITIPVMLSVGNTFVVGETDVADEPSAGALQFSAPSYTVAENAGNASIEVTRVGGSAGAVSIRVTTSDGTATAGADYSATDTVVSFADGDTVAKIVMVPILEDAIIDANETVNLTLSAITGGASIGTPSMAVLTIVDVPPPSSPPPAPPPSANPPRSRGGGGLDATGLLALLAMLAWRIRTAASSRSRTTSR